MKVHELKIDSQYYASIRDMTKPFELRKNDRDYKVGDVLKLREIIDDIPSDCTDYPHKVYTGNFCNREITYILRGGQYGLNKDYVILGLKIYEEDHENL